MSFDPEQLKRIALDVRAAKTEIFEAPPESDWTEEDIKNIVTDMEMSVVAFAEDGELQLPYRFKPEDDIRMIREAAIEFKLKQPRLMVILSEGEKCIHITWDGKNHV